jgi:hypothetical protein
MTFQGLRSGPDCPAYCSLPAVYSLGGDAEHNPALAHRFGDEISR